MVSFHIQNNEENGFQIGNNNSRNSEAAKNSKKAEKKELKNGTIFAGNTNLSQDPIAMKRIKARKDAMKGIIGKFAADRKTDDDLTARKQHIYDLQAENEDMDHQIGSLNELKSSLKEAYGITDDSQEQKDLELLEKARNSNKEGAPKLTEEERKYIETMAPLTEYQERVRNLDKGISELQNQKEKANDLIRSESDTIASIKQAIELSSGMTPEVKKAEVILENASKDIVGMLFDEVKQHIDEELAKNQAEIDKKAEEKAEKEKAEMEKAEKEKVEEEAVEAAKVSSNTETDVLLQESDGYIEKLKEIQNIIQKLNLLEADTKGVLVDEQI